MKIYRSGCMLLRDDEDARARMGRSKVMTRVLQIKRKFLCEGDVRDNIYAEVRFVFFFPSS